MQFIRRTAVGVAASLLVLTLFSFGLSFGIQQVFGSPDAVKGALRTSGFYDNAVGAALDQAQKNMTKEKRPGAEKKNDVPLDNPDVQAIIKKAASPSFLQGQSEGALDGLYNWLGGKTSSLDATVDLTDVKVHLADGLYDYVISRLSALPTCTAASQLPSADVNAFSATCVPPGFDVTKAATEARNQIMHGDFLKDTKLTASTIKNGQGQTLEQQLKKAPAAFQRANQGVYTTGALALLLAVAIVFMSSSRRTGVRKVAITFITVGTVVGILGWMTDYGLQRATTELAKTSTTTPFQDQILAVAKPIVHDLRFWWMAFGITLVVLGIAKLVALHFIKPGGEQKIAGPMPSVGPTGEAMPEDKPAADGIVEKPAPPTSTKPKTSPNKRRLIQ